jgi:hypothetical protein
MLTVATMAVFAHNAIGEGSVGFALAYATFHLILCCLWGSQAWYKQEERRVSKSKELISSGYNDRIRIK